MRPDIGGEALGGFIQCWGGRAGVGENHCTQFQITINHPAMSTIKKLLLELQHPENVSFSKQGTKPTGGESTQEPLKWVGGYYDCSTCMCLHGSCVVRLS